jgi:hypothetical protein
MGRRIILSSPQKTLIEMMFEQHGYTDQDIKDFFERGRMSARFGRELKCIRDERAARAIHHKLELATD